MPFLIVLVIPLVFVMLAVVPAAALVGVVWMGAAASASVNARPVYLMGRETLAAARRVRERVKGKRLVVRYGDRELNLAPERVSLHLVK